MSSSGSNAAGVEETRSVVSDWSSLSYPCFYAGQRNSCRGFDSRLIDEKRGHICRDGPLMSVVNQCAWMLKQAPEAEARATATRECHCGPCRTSLF